MQINFNWFEWNWSVVITKTKQNISIWLDVRPRTTSTATLEWEQIDDGHNEEITNIRVIGGIWTNFIDFFFVSALGAFCVVAAGASHFSIHETRAVRCHKLIMEKEWWVGGGEVVDSTEKKLILERRRCLFIPFSLLFTFTTPSTRQLSSMTISNPKINIDEKLDLFHFYACVTISLSIMLFYNQHVSAVVVIDVFLLFLFFLHPLTETIMWREKKQLVVKLSNHQTNTLSLALVIQWHLILQIPNLTISHHRGAIKISIDMQMKLWNCRLLLCEMNANIAQLGWIAVKYLCYI